MIFEDFISFAYMAMFILGVLLSAVPAYIAFRRNKSFWAWWIATLVVFSISFYFLMKAQVIIETMYLLAIFPLALVLASLPKKAVSNLPLPLASIFKASSNLLRNKEARLFFIILVVMLAIGAFLFYYSFIYPWLDYLKFNSINKDFLVVPVVRILIACIGYSFFMLVISTRATKKIFISLFLVSLLAVILSEKTYVFMSVEPIRFFVLLGISAGYISILIVLNDKYPFLQVLSKLAGFLLYSLSLISHQLPVIRLTRSRYVSSYFLAGVFLLWFLLLRLFDHMNEVLGLILYIPFTVLAFIISLVGIILSTIVIVISVKQLKVLAGSAIFLIGVFAVSKNPTLGWAGFTLWGVLLFYGLASGFAALILWVISDYLVQNSE
jgi:hypothetical protein